MPTLREIRRRISGVKSTQKITKAMKMVAAAKLRRAQDAIISARPYARKIKELMQHLSARIEDPVNPLLVPRPTDGVAFIIVTSDRGLCGAFNTNIIRSAIQHVKANYAEMNEAGNLKLICVGKKGYDYFIRRDYEITSKHIGLFATLDFGKARAIVDEFTQGYLSGEFDLVEVIYNGFKSIMQQKIVVEHLLPIPPEESRTTSIFNYIYEPSSVEIINTLLPNHLNFQM